MPQTPKTDPPNARPRRRNVRAGLPAPGIRRHHRVLGQGPDHVAESDGQRVLAGGAGRREDVRQVAVSVHVWVWGVDF